MPPRLSHTSTLLRTHYQNIKSQFSSFHGSSVVNGHLLLSRLITHGSGRWLSPVTPSMKNGAHSPLFPNARANARASSSDSIAVKPNEQESNALGYTNAHAQPELELEALAPPQPINGWPTPLVTQSDIDTYFPALYSSGWSVGKVTDKKETSGTSLALAIKYILSDTDLVPSLLSWIHDLEQEENHHTTLKCTDSKHSPVEVCVYLQTHSGLREAAYPDEPKKKRKMPGITLRDVRFALLLNDKIDKLGGQGNALRAEPVDSLGTPFRPMQAVELHRH